MANKFLQLQIFDAGKAARLQGIKQHQNPAERHGCDEVGEKVGVPRPLGDLVQTLENQIITPPQAPLQGPAHRSHPRVRLLRPPLLRTARVTELRQKEQQVVDPDHSVAIHILITGGSRQWVTIAIEERFSEDARAVVRCGFR